MAAISPDAGEPSRLRLSGASECHHPAGGGGGTLIPDRLRARLNAYESMLCTAAGAVLSLAIGALGEVLDYRLCMTICGLIAMAVCWLTVFLRRRQVQLVLTDRPGETQPDTLS